MNPLPIIKEGTEMKVLVIYAHPNPASFCHAVLETVTETLKSGNHTVEIRDLYAIRFDPILKPADFEGIGSGNVPEDIKTEQNHISWAERIIVIHPVWWTGLPAVIKGYVDRVFSYGFAYSVNDQGIVKLLGGKKVVIINTQGTPKEPYEASGMFEAMKKTSDTGIYQFCGMEVLNHIFFPAVPYVDDNARRDYLATVKEVIASI